MISFLTAVTVVLGMKMMGSVLVSSLIIFPAITAGKLAKSFKAVVIAAAVISVSCFVIGILVSFVLDLPTGASVVAVNVVLLAIASIIGKKRG